MPNAKTARQRVLVVDDDFVIRGMFSAAFERNDLEVDVAESGQEALGLLKLYPDRYLAVVLDLNIPPPDGLAIARYVSEAIPDLPVVVLSADADSADRVREAELARTVKFIIRKPADPMQLAGVIAEYVDRRLRARRPE